MRGGKIAGAPSDSNKDSPGRWKDSIADSARLGPRVDSKVGVKPRTTREPESSWSALCDVSLRIQSREPSQDHFHSAELLRLQYASRNGLHCPVDQSAGRRSWYQPRNHCWNFMGPIAEIGELHKVKTRQTMVMNLGIIMLLIKWCELKTWRV